MENTAVNIMKRGPCLDFAQLIRLGVQDILPIVGTIVASRRAPFNEEDLIRGRIVARRLVGLEWQVMEPTNLSIGPDKIKELLVICHKVCGVEILQAVAA